MAGHNVHIRVADGDKRLVEIGLFADLAGGAQQAAVWRALETFLDGVGAHQRRSVVDGILDRKKK